MELKPSIKELLKATAKELKSSARRVFMARTVRELGKGGIERAGREMGWSRAAIQKGMHELESGIACVDAFNARGRRRAEERLPNLLEDIAAIVDGQSQTDGSFKSSRLYTRLSAAEVRRQLITQKGYTDEGLPSGEVIRQRLNELGYRLRAVRKSTPQKKWPKQMRSLSK